MLLTTIKFNVCHLKNILFFQELIVIDNYFEVSINA